MVVFSVTSTGLSIDSFYINWYRYPIDSAPDIVNFPCYEAVKPVQNDMVPNPDRRQPVSHLHTSATGWPGTTARNPYRVGTRS